MMAMFHPELPRDEDFPLDEEADWKPGDPCHQCGSTDTTWDTVDGAICHNCGGQDFIG